MERQRKENTVNDGHKEITQTVAKAAAKTAAQAFIAALAILLVPVLTEWTATVTNGGEIELDANFFQKVLIAATGAAIAALISFAQNSLKS